MRVEQVEDYLKIENSNQEILIDSDCVTIRNKNITLTDLEQKIIDYLYNKFEKKLIIDEVDVNLFKILKKD